MPCCRLFWARQYQLKLKKRAADIQQELLEDEAIVEDLLRGLLPDDTDHQVGPVSHHSQKHRRMSEASALMAETKYIESHIN